MYFDISLYDKTPTLCFITMCKNEENCIRQTLESVYKYIDYWIVCDTGSTDKTCEIVEGFFKEKNIPGELFIDEWKGFDKNKSLMFERAYKKTDYVLHLDADDCLIGNFDKKLLIDRHIDVFNFNYKRGISQFKTSSLYNNHLKWIYVGVAHNLIKCIDKTSGVIFSDIFVNDDLYVDNNERGSRKLDPNKYLNDALKLKEQFFDTLYEDPYGLNNRTIFYTAQSYFDFNNFKEAYKWYNLYTKLKDNWIEEEFESNCRLGRCLIHLNEEKSKIIAQFEKAIKILPDRAEPYYMLGRYLNENSEHEKAYFYLSTARKQNFEEINKKYLLFVTKLNYGKYVNDELSVACYWTNRGSEGFKYLMEIIDDDEYINHKERLEKNKCYFITKYELM
jgi:hypothetical protein